MRRVASLGLFWFMFFCGLGVFFPYYSLYLRENVGLDGIEVGLVLAVFPLMGFLAQPLWGQIADRSGARSSVLALITVGAAAGMALLYQARGFTATLLITAGLAFFATAVIPATVALSLGALRDFGPHAFGLVRVWGTVGFLVVVVAFPVFLRQMQAARGLHAVAGGPSEPGLELMFLVTAALFLLAAVIALVLPRRGDAALRAAPGEWRLLLRSRPFLRVLVFASIAFFCFQGPMILFPVYVRSLGGDIEMVGRMWLPMLLVEIPLIALSGTGLRRFGARGLLIAGCLAGGVRWTVCGLTDDLRLVFVAQLLHGLFVTGILLGGPLYIEQVVPERLRSTAQALYALCGGAIGASLSNVVCGILLEHYGADAPYLMGGVGALLLGLVVPWLLPAPERLRQG